MYCVIRVSFCLIAVTFFLMAFLSGAAAQTPSTPHDAICGGAYPLKIKGCADAITIGGTRSTRIFTHESAPTVEDFHLRLKRIRDDLDYLETANRYLRSAADEDHLNLMALAKTADEIRKRAIRLRNFLALPSLEAGNVKRIEITAGPQQLREPVIALTSLITSVLSNPASKGRILDLKHSATTQRCLNAIVELSAQIKNSSKAILKNEQ